MSDATQTTAARRFAAHALDTPFTDLPAGAVEAAKTFILDTIGVGIAGARAPYADQVLRVAEGWGEGDRGAYVWARGRRLPAPAAAFVNGFQIHCQEFDCVYEPAVVHPMAVLLASLMAEADMRGDVAGSELIAATALGVDVAAGLGVASNAPIRFFRPATAGVFAATLGVARLRGFDAVTGLNALGFALAHCSGSMQAHVEGKPALPVQIANAARAAVVSCDLAGAGVPGPQNVFEGPFGYFPLFEGDWDLAPVLDVLGETWRITEVSHKPFPTGRAAHGGIVAVQRLRERGLAAANLESLTLTAPPIIKRLVGRPYKDDMNVNYARLCFPYIGAVALRKGSVGLEDFSPQALADPATGALARRIRVIDDGSSDPAAFTPQTAAAQLMDGRALTVEIETLFGSFRDPLSREAHLEKFRQCVAFGFGEPRDELARDLIARVDSLEAASDAGALSRLASGCAENSAKPA